MGLSNVKSDTNAPAEFATNLIFQRFESAVQKAVGKVNIVDNPKKPGNPDKGVNLLTVVQAGNLDFVISVNLAGGVFERCHNCLFLLPGTGPGRWVVSLSQCKGRHYFLNTKSFFIIFAFFVQKKLFTAFFRFKGLSSPGW